MRLSGVRHLPTPSILKRNLEGQAPAFPPAFLRHRRTLSSRPLAGCLGMRLFQVLA